MECIINHVIRTQFNAISYFKPVIFIDCVIIVASFSLIFSNEAGDALLYALLYF